MPYPALWHALWCNASLYCSVPNPAASRGAEYVIAQVLVLPIYFIGHLDLPNTCTAQTSSIMNGCSACAAFLGALCAAAVCMMSAW